eukprot:1688753-Rhodomonas_salina.2
MEDHRDELSRQRLRGARRTCAPVPPPRVSQAAARESESGRETETDRGGATRQTEGFARERGGSKRERERARERETRREGKRASAHRSRCRRGRRSWCAPASPPPAPQTPFSICGLEAF